MTEHTELPGKIAAEMVVLGAASLLGGHLLLESLSVALVCKDLLLLERFLGKADLDFDDRSSIDNACPGLALIDKELVTRDFDSLTLLEVAREATEEVGLQDLGLDQFDCLAWLAARCLERLLGRPDGGYADNAHAFGHA